MNEESNMYATTSVNTLGVSPLVGFGSVDVKRKKKYKRKERVYKSKAMRRRARKEEGNNNFGFENVDGLPLSVELIISLLDPPMYDKLSAERFFATLAPKSFGNGKFETFMTGIVIADFSVKFFDYWKDGQGLENSEVTDLIRNFIDLLKTMYLTLFNKLIDNDVLPALVYAYAYMDVKDVEYVLFHHTSEELKQDCERLLGEIY